MSEGIIRRNPRDSELRSLRTVAIPATSLADRLGLERQRVFVGRKREIANFRQLLVENTYSLMVVTGHAGVGKTTLLRELGRQALAAGHRVVSLDWLTLDEQLIHSRPALLRELALRFEEAPELLEPKRGVLLIDGLDATNGVAERVLVELAEVLDRDVLLVLSTRSGAEPAWALDPAWSGLTTRCHLPPLNDAHAVELLVQRGVPSPAHDHLVELAAGSPLVLAVAADLFREEPSDRFTLEHLQRVQHRLSRLLCPEPVSPMQQLALDVCAMSRVTTAELIEHVRRASDPLHSGTGPDPFDWLAHQSFVDWTPAGVEVHPVLRIALQARLRRERPRRYSSLLQTMRDYCVSELESGTSPDAEFLNLFFLDRDLPMVRRWAPPELRSSSRPLQPADENDRAEIVELVRALEGDEAAALAADRVRDPNERFEVVRQRQLEGFLYVVPFDAQRGPTPTSADPALAIVRRYMAEHPLQGDEEALLVRWFVDREHYQAPSARVLAITGRQTQLILANKNMRYSFCVFRSVGDWTPLWKGIDLPWQVLDRFTLDGNEYSVVLFSWQRRSLRDVMINAWRSTGAGDSDALDGPSPVDELRLKVGERVSRLAKQVSLTPREIEILEQLCLGHSFEDIARALSIRPRTVKFHQENLLRKTGAASRVELFRKLL